MDRDLAGGGEELCGARTWGELRKGGLSSRRVERLAREGVLRVVRTGVYVPSAIADSLTVNEQGSHLLAAAALAGTGPGWAGSHRSAALAYGLGVVRQPGTGRVEVTRAPEASGSRSRRAGVLVHTAALPGEHVTAIRGVPLTSAARTVVDLARMLPFAEGVAVADSALRAVKTTRREIDAVLARCVRWPGVQQARRVAVFADPRAESVLESLGRVAFHQAGLPPPDLQVWVGDEGEVIGRVDFLWRRYATIAEADGAIKYRNPQQARAQLARDARLRGAGYEVVHFTWPEITRVPGQVASAVAAAFQASAGRQPARG